MNIKLLVLALLGACLQSVNGSKSYKKENNGGRLMSIGKFCLGLLSLNCATLAGNAKIDCPGQSMEVIKASEFACGYDYSFFDGTSNSSFCECLKKCEISDDCIAISHGDKSKLKALQCELHNSIGKTYFNDLKSEHDTAYMERKFRCYHVLRHCPLSLPPNALVMMDYIRCSDEPNNDFLAKYLTPEKNLQPCSKMQALYENAQKLGECISKGSANIVKSAKARILGQNIPQNTQAMMFEDYLGNFENLETKEALELVEIFEKNEEFDFFRVKAAVDVLGKANNLINPIKWTLENYEAYKEYDFDRVEYVANLLKPLVQKIDENNPLSLENKMYVYQQALESWIQREPLEKIEEAIQNAESAKNKKLTWEMKASRIKKKYDL